MEIFSARGMWLLVVLPPLWGLLLGRMTWQVTEAATRPLGRSTPLQLWVRRLGRLTSVLTAVAVLCSALALAASASWTVILAPLLLTVALWGLYFPTLGRFLSLVARDGSALKRRVQRLTRWSTLAVLLLLPLTGLLPEVLQAHASGWLFGIGALWLLLVTVAAVVLPWSWLLVMRGFWVGSAQAEDPGMETIREVLASQSALTVIEQPMGLVAEGSRGGLRISVSLDLARAPGELRITVVGPRMATRYPDLMIRRRAKGEEGGVRLADPVLSGTLLVRAANEERAGALCQSLHTQLLPIFHPFEQAHLAAGRLTLRISGPPFGTAKDARDVASFISDQITECVTLMKALEERAGQTDARHRRTASWERQ